MISFSIDLLKNQDIHFEGQEPSSFLQIEDSEMMKFKDNIYYKLHASMVSNKILVKGNASCTYEGLCGRCLKKFNGTFSNSNICLFYEELYGAELDISKDIRENLLIEMPLNCICKDNCKGLCHTCGTNLNKKQCNCKEDDNKENPWDSLNKLKL
jgi:uncharacterized protein